MSTTTVTPAPALTAPALTGRVAGASGRSVVDYPYASQAAHRLADVAAAATRTDQLSHAVDRAVLAALIGVGYDLLGAERGTGFLTAGSQALRQHREHSDLDELDLEEVAVADLVLALGYALAGDEHQAVSHLQQAAGRLDQHPADELLIPRALLGVIYAKLSAADTLTSR